MKKILVMLFLVALMNKGSMHAGTTLACYQDEDLGDSCNYCQGCCSDPAAERARASKDCIPQMLYNECGLGTRQRATQ